MGRACFEKSRKRVTSIDVDVPRLRADGAVAKSGFLDADAVTRKEEMRETSVVCGGEGGEVLEGGGEARVVRVGRVVAWGFGGLERGRCGSAPVGDSVAETVACCLSLASPLPAK